MWTNNKEAIFCLFPTCSLLKLRSVNAVSSPISLGIDAIPLPDKTTSVVVDTGKDSGPEDVVKDTHGQGAVGELVGALVGETVGVLLGDTVGVLLGRLVPPQEPTTLVSKEQKSAPDGQKSALASSHGIDM